jgi:hypothetical protein
MNEQPAKDHPDRHTAASAQAEVAHLRQTVQTWIDSDRVLSADGSALLAMLARAQEALASEDSEERAPGAAAQAGITAFVRQVQALVAAGDLEASDSHLPLAAAALLLAGLPSAGATDGETDRWRADASRAQSRPAAEDSRAGSGDEHCSSRSERNSER